MIRRDNYPILPMSVMPATLLATFQAERAIEDNPEFDGDWIDRVEVQTAYSAFSGAKDRSLVSGGLEGHDKQAAAIIVAVSELDSFLEGSVTCGGRAAVRRKLDREEMTAIETARETMIRLLTWHFKNGAGALLPLAEFYGLVERAQEKAA